jgi:hypothetical protein
VLDQHDRRLPGRLDVIQSAHQGVGAERIEVRGWLVEDEQARTRCENPGEGEPLLLAAREVGGPAPLETRETHLGERLRNTRPHLGGRRAAVLEAEGDVIFGSLHHELAIRVLEQQADPAAEPRPGGTTVRGDVGAVEGQAPPPLPWELVRDETGEGKCKRALARPGRPDDEEELAGVEGEGQVPQRVTSGVGVAEAEAVGTDRDGARPPLGRCAQAGNPSRTPVCRNAETMAIATSGRTTSPDAAMNPARTASAPAS